MALLLGFVASAHAGQRCGDLTPPALTAATPSRTVTADDLARLRDIGQAAPDEPISPLAVSPDGTAVAFQLRRAEPASNDYCLGMYVLQLEPERRLVQVDLGGGFMLDHIAVDGHLTHLSSGYPAAIHPKWSPDGRWIAYLRRDGGITQVWRARADGSRSEAISRSLVDVDDFAWTTHGDAIVYETHPGIAQANRALNRQALTGFHFDDSVDTGAGARPLALDHAGPAFATIDLATGTACAATPAERALLVPTVPPGLPANADLAATSAAGRRAWVTPRAILPTSRRLWVTDEHSRPVPCGDSRCQGRLTDLWWSADGRTLVYFRREGWAYSRIGVYRWRPGSPPHRILVTDDVLLGCQPAGNELVCAEEGSTRPRYLVLFDMASGARHLLFDPNPEFRHIRLGSVERLHWRNDIGFETIGDLVLPPDYRPGTKLPLIVVQYSTRGFLRGGTGNDYPIQLFAAHGFAVLSFQRPRDYGELTGTQDPKIFFRADLRHFADRRSVLSSLETGVRLLIKRGIVDPSRVGLTGLSDGASTVQFALLHSSTMFAAVAASACCMDRDAMLWASRSFADLYHFAGYPLISDPAPGFAAGYFLSASAQAMNIPMLIQASDHEYLSGLFAVTALRELGKPVDLYVYPHEFHVKWQPAHRIAVYDRDLQWFDFWLQGREDPDPVDPAQYQRWSAWKAARHARAAQKSGRLAMTPRP